jgi:secreted trypsin-like serine protease
MLNHLILASLLALLLSCLASSDHQRVIGGQPVQLGDYGYLVYIVADNGLPNTFACGGGILNKRYVITAGHCIASSLFVIYGTLSVNGYKQSNVVQVQRWIRHPKYDIETKAWDIALLELAEDIPENFPYVHYLTVSTVAPPMGYPMQIAGYGLYEDNQDTSSPRYGTVHVGPDSGCPFSGWSSQYWFCVSDEKVRSCPGDSGSPLVVRNGDRWAIVGIDSVTLSTDCANSSPSTAETKVANMIDFLVANTPLAEVEYVATVYNTSLVATTTTTSTPGVIVKSNSGKKLAAWSLVTLLVIFAL